MIAFAVHLKIALINTGRHNGLVGHGYSEHCSALIVKRTLDANIIGRTVRFCTKTEHIAAEVDIAAGGSFLIQVIFHAVCNISFGDAAEINFGGWIF